MKSGRYDSAERRKATRVGRQKGCRVYITADELERAGWPLDGPLPYFRVWPRPGRRSLAISFYGEK